MMSPHIRRHAVKRRRALLARLVNTLDHLTEGRVGWDCVTSSKDGAAQNCGRREQPLHDEHDDLTDDFTDLVTKLGRVGTGRGATGS